MSLSHAELERFAAGLAAAPERWRHLVSAAGEGARVYAPVWSDEEVNAWVICWSHDSDTGWHDHDESSGGIAVVSGRIREERLVLGTDPWVRRLGAGETFTVPATAIHRVLHDGGGPAVTVHAYSPPLRRMGAYRVGAGGVLERESVPSETELQPAQAAAA
ncbi:MAG TPA: cysteine dioxygenase family protein [Solirubrobacteraceae bacterium]|jgi:mannose-6-phosphate isomerase-like protein (cupin superfamily)|nr:cysteine dioxygenase family protein [Solirubrobacteraceae bacterium]